MLRRVFEFLHHEAGFTAVEYALLAAIITVVTTFAVSAAGYSIADIF